MNSINLAPVLEPLIQVAGLVLIALVVPAVNKFAAFFAARTHVVLSRQAIEAVEGAVTTAATMLQVSATKAGGRAVLHVSSPEMALAVNHVLNSVPDSLEHLGVDPVTISNKILTTVLRDPFFDGAARSGSLDGTTDAPFVPTPAPPPARVPVATIGQ